MSSDIAQATAFIVAHPWMCVVIAALLGFIAGGRK